MTIELWYSCKKGEIIRSPFGKTNLPLYFSMLCSKVNRQLLAVSMGHGESGCQQQPIEYHEKKSRSYFVAWAWFILKFKVKPRQFIKPTVGQFPCVQGPEVGPQPWAFSQIWTCLRLFSPNVFLKYAMWPSSSKTAPNSELQASVSITKESFELAWPRWEQWWENLSFCTSEYL